ncbi:MAG TPA: tetratricopeptide repeat protein [Rectinemataceae bacterium]|nr:tetratricopeptide repeat protein [Rectinemataceae bacterium]
MRLHPLLPLFLLVACLPLSAQNLREKGDALIQAGRFNEARTLGLTALNANPGDTEASILVCESLLGLSLPEDAANYAAKAWDLHKDPRIAALLGEAYFDTGRNDDALTWLRYYLTALPEGPRAGLVYYLTGEIYLRLGRYGHADMAIATAIYHSPGNARWWSRLGWAQEKAGDYRQALKSYESALGIDPRLDDAVIGRQRILARLRG